jgi:hypothetical protein
MGTGGKRGKIRRKENDFGGGTEGAGERGKIKRKEKDFWGGLLWVGWVAGWGHDSFHR